MKQIKFLLALAPALFVWTASAQTPVEVNTKFNEAASLIQAKHYDKAIPILKTVIEMGQTLGEEVSEPVSKAQTILPDCYLRYGLMFCSAGKYEEGIVNLTEAATLGDLYGNPKAARSSRENISKVYMAMGAKAFNDKDYAKAITIFAKGYEAYPTNTDLALNLAESYAESDDLTNAMKIYGNIAALETQHSRYKDSSAKAREKMAYYLKLRASELATKGKIQDAYAFFEDILRDDPDNADIHLMRIKTATNASQWNKVIEWGEAAAAAQTILERQSDVNFYLGAAYQNSDNVQSAIATYEKVTAGNNVVKAKEQIRLLNNPPKK